MRPSVSVLIDTYNHEKYIEQCVLSAVEQDFPASDYEIVVVDDGSADKTPEIVRRIAARPSRPVLIRLVRKTNGGQASAFNAGVPEARGEIVAFLDGDDWFAPGKLTAVTMALEQHPEAVAVGHGLYDFDERTHEVKILAPAQKEFVHLGNPEAAAHAMSAWQFVLMGALTVRRNMLEQLMPVPESLVFCADAPISWGAVAGGLLLLPEPLFYYRHHPDNLFSPDRGRTEQLQRRYQMIEFAYASTESLLIRLGVKRDCARSLLYPQWVTFSRTGLSTYGGARLQALRTEMRDFGLEYPNPTVRYRLFKYAVVGAATLLLSPKAFYRARDWYFRRNLGRIREHIARAR